eukprot:TRINITY_DN3951_c0_g1_i1.p1 TRINITY_DN3951_c0_g1~~TRINITY_DN3951_c0_g1_i1.p1  ORF type:complete len:290 (+),score=73.74 TRINITY_DN3951_c0_g1_i1:441-1310(+)
MQQTGEVERAFLTLHTSSNAGERQLAHEWLLVWQDTTQAWDDCNRMISQTLSIYEQHYQHYQQQHRQHVCLPALDPSRALFGALTLHHKIEREWHTFLLLDAKWKQLIPILFEYLRRCTNPLLPDPYVALLVPIRARLGVCIASILVRTTPVHWPEGVDDVLKGLTDPSEIVRSACDGGGGNEGDMDGLRYARMDIALIELMEAVPDALSQTVCTQDAKKQARVELLAKSSVLINALLPWCVHEAHTRNQARQQQHQKQQQQQHQPHHQQRQQQQQLQQQQRHPQPNSE